MTEKYFLDLDLQTLLAGISVNDEFLVDLQLSFVTVLLRLNQVQRVHPVSQFLAAFWCANPLKNDRELYV